MSTTSVELMGQLAISLYTEVKVKRGSLAIIGWNPLFGQKCPSLPEPTKFFFNSVCSFDH